MARAERRRREEEWDEEERDERPRRRGLSGPAIALICVGAGALVLAVGGVGFAMMLAEAGRKAKAAQAQPAAYPQATIQEICAEWKRNGVAAQDRYRGGVRFRGELIRIGDSIFGDTPVYLSANGDTVNVWLPSSLLPRLKAARVGGAVEVAGRPQASAQAEPRFDAELFEPLP